MMWQMWTAFGIMLGYVADLAFYKVPDRPHIKGLNWRLMLASVRTSIHLLIRFRTNSAIRQAFQHSSSWHRCSSALNHLVGSSPRVDTRMRTGRSNDSVATQYRRLVISTVRFFPIPVAPGLIRHQTYTYFSRRRRNSLVGVTATLNCSPFPVTVVRLSVLS
jgi:hypothetical protein